MIHSPSIFLRQLSFIAIMERPSLKAVLLVRQQKFIAMLLPKALSYKLYFIKYKCKLKCHKQFKLGSVFVCYETMMSKPWCQNHSHLIFSEFHYKAAVKPFWLPSFLFIWLKVTRISALFPGVFPTAFEVSKLPATALVDGGETLTLSSVSAWIWLHVFCSKSFSNSFPVVFCATGAVNCQPSHSLLGSWGLFGTNTHIHLGGGGKKLLTDIYITGRLCDFLRLAEHPTSRKHCSGKVYWFSADP